MLWLWSDPPESSCLFSFASAFQLFLAVESSSLFLLCVCLIFFLFSRRCCTDELETLHVDWTNVLCIPRQNQGRGLWPPPPSHVMFYWPFQGGASAVVYYFCHCISLGSHLAIFFKETVLLAFCLSCFDCDAVALSVSFFPMVSWTKGVT